MTRTLLVTGGGGPWILKASRGAAGVRGGRVGGEERGEDGRGVEGGKEGKGGDEEGEGGRKGIPFPFRNDLNDISPVLNDYYFSQ